MKLTETILAVSAVDVWLRDGGCYLRAGRRRCPIKKSVLWPLRFSFVPSPQRDFRIHITPAMLALGNADRATQPTLDTHQVVSTEPAFPRRACILVGFDAHGRHGRFFRVVVTCP